MSLLPPPPVMQKQQPQAHSNYAQTLQQSMTIEEMRQLHQRALSEAEAKQTELRLVLASRYRELVGSSDEVTKMRERAQELHELVHALPTLMEKLIQSKGGVQPLQEEHDEEQKQEESSAQDISAVVQLRRDLSILPRVVHRALDRNNVHDATTSLMQLFQLIAEQTQEYPLATALAKTTSSSHTPPSQLDDLVRAQMRMTFLHVQTLPAKIRKISKQLLNDSASYGEGINPSIGAQTSAAALSTLDLLETSPQRDRQTHLLDLYLDSKAQLLQSLLNQLSKHKNDHDTDGGAHTAEEILSKIVLILQSDIIVHPYQIFVLRRFSCDINTSNCEAIIKSLPIFSPHVVQSKASNFLAAHLPLIRTKVKSILVDIAGTTASALGKIRQSLYDKTDGLECMERLDSHGVCTWEQAVSGMVHMPTVLTSTTPTGPLEAANTHVERKFSLWGVLFSHTFSSLVHSLLTASFQSVHISVASTLRLSLANAPPLSNLLPHEAYRNTLHIASELDTALLKVSADAHELLVHAEEREESERRLKQSLYVQTCEIMGRLICELRRMLATKDSSSSSSGHDTNHAFKELIVGRVCHLLKFRLTALPRLLDEQSSPAVLHGSSGMISLLELQSAFDLADDNEDGLITFKEAMEAVDSAFSGTQFHGAEMVRETLLLSGDQQQQAQDASNHPVATPQDVTLNELTLLSARGLRHEATGRHSALGIIQESLDDIISTCFQQWAKVALSEATDKLSESITEFVRVSSKCTTDDEYKRMFAPDEIHTTGPVVSNISPHIVGYLLDMSFVLNRSICPSDSLLPVPSMEYALSMGMTDQNIPRMMDMIRWALLRQGFASVATTLGQMATDLSESGLASLAESAKVQLKNDIDFCLACFLDRNKHNFGNRGNVKESIASFEDLAKNIDRVAPRVDQRLLDEKRSYVFEVCDLYFSSLFGEDSSSAVALGDLGDMSSLAAPRAAANPLLHTPLNSTCRFSLLPIQSDRTLADVQLRGKHKDKDEHESRQDAASGSGVIGSGFGFFSSMLKKN
jgi:hypothetical protein